MTARRRPDPLPLSSRRPADLDQWAAIIGPYARNWPTMSKHTDAEIRRFVDGYRDQGLTYTDLADAYVFMCDQYHAAIRAPKRADPTPRPAPRWQAWLGLVVGAGDWLAVRAVRALRWTLWTFLGTEERRIGLTLALIFAFLCGQVIRAVSR